VNQWSPCKRKQFIQKLRKLGFDGPFSGSRHQFMAYKNHRLAIPSNKEYSVPQLKFILHEVSDILNSQITFDKWQNL
jgi:hypothetical protein